jgi:hypothetical protein
MSTSAIVAGWQYIDSADFATGVHADGSPQFIVGDGAPDGQGGDDTHLLTVNSVPEPAAAMVLSMVGVGFLIRRRGG